MARMKRREKGTRNGAAHGKRPTVTSPLKAGAQRGDRGMDRNSRLMVVGLMGALLVLFLLIGVFAPDPFNPQGRPGGSTILWRLFFLLVPLGIMYGLLWGEKLLGFLRRSEGRTRP